MRTSHDLVCFDLDGTLVETAPEILDAVNDTLARFALPRVTQAQVEGWIGHGTGELLVQALAQATGTAPGLVRGSTGFQLAQGEFGTYYGRRCGTRSRLYPHVRQVLQGLRERGSRTALLTNKEAHFARGILRAHGLEALLDHVVGGDSLAHRKPHPQGLLACLQAFGCPPGRALMVGDSAIDVETARHAGVAVWAVRHGYNRGQPIEASRPDRVIDDLRAVLEVEQETPWH